MLTPILQSALVALITALLSLACDWLGVAVDKAVLAALAVAIVAKILGEASGVRAAARFQGTKG